MIKTNTCNKCKFWDVRVARTGLGECRRNPPLPAFEPQGSMGRISPHTGAYFWCGEFQPSGSFVASGQDEYAAAGMGAAIDPAFAVASMIRLRDARKKVVESVDNYNGRRQVLKEASVIGHLDDEYKTMEDAKKTFIKVAQEIAQKLTGEIE